MSKISSARWEAFRILADVEGGAHSTDLLYRRSGRLDPRDAGLMTELVLGCLRRRRQLRALLESASGRKAQELDPQVVLALEMGIYQLRFLDRVPAHAAVCESVELVKRAQKARAAGLVNAVLRKIRREKTSWLTGAIEVSLPDWLWTRWVERFGEAAARRIGQAFIEPAERFVRVASGGEEEARGLGMEPVEDVPGCWVAPSDAGRFRHQDVGAQVVAALVEPRRGDRVLDLCASPGNKTAQLMESGAWVVAGERSGRRLAPLLDVGCPLLQLDATKPLPFQAVFDRVLVDAPCSGTGTLGRNPEIRWRIHPEDIARQAERQEAMLGHALAALKPGGRLVYATCSLEREEGEDVVANVLAEAGSGVRLEREIRRLPGRDRGDGFYVAVLTS